MPPLQEIDTERRPYKGGEGAGTLADPFVPWMGYRPDLALGAKSLALTCAAGVGQVPIPDTAHLIGIKPAATTVRVGLEAPEADGVATGTALAADLKKGCPCDQNVWTWFYLGIGTNRILYVKGAGAADVLEVAIL